MTVADRDNGCPGSVPGNHREGSHPHEAGKIAREPLVPESIIAGRTGTPLPVRRGGAIRIHKQNIYRSLPNRSDRLRRSVDLRYHPIGQPGGRPAFPGFVARSRSGPASELRHAETWRQNRESARRYIVSGEYASPVFRGWRYPRVGRTEARIGERRRIREFSRSSRLLLPANLSHIIRPSPIFDYIGQARLKATSRQRRSRS